ncbi:retrovirus-related Pol polyprotein from transposon 297 [Trichonephila clavipes]|nr:retrovirus-related Pol polyprotein from transposon 297 [Trichonephila clavipes]
MDSASDFYSKDSHVAVKPPPFWKHNPALWFVRLEAQFDLAKILNDTTKFNYVLSAVESDILNSVSDLVLKPPENGKYEVLKKRLIEVHSESIIRPSKSSWASPLHVVKKSNGEYRPCGDYRRLNSVTVPDRCPVPHIQDCTQNLYGKTIITTLNLARTYHQIAINQPDIPKTSVTTPFSLFEYTAMPFGLRNSGQTFQRHMHQVLAHLEFCIPYFDDLLIASSSENEHLDHLHQIFSRLRDYGLKLNTDKCVLGKTSVKFLGCLITAEGVKPLLDKVEAIANFPKPDTISQLRHFLAMLNFYRRFLPQAANAQAPLNKLFTNCKKKSINVPFLGTRKQRSHFCNANPHWLTLLP